jgi:hypothetical protein
MPKSCGADEMAVLDRDERQFVGRKAPLAQSLGRLGEARRSECRVEQAFPRRDIG